VHNSNDHPYGKEAELPNQSRPVRRPIRFASSLREANPPKEIGKARLCAILVPSWLYLDEGKTDIPVPISLLQPAEHLILFSQPRIHQRNMFWSDILSLRHTIQVIEQPASLPWVAGYCVRIGQQGFGF